MQTFHGLKMGLASALILSFSNMAVAQPSYCDPCLFYGGDLDSTTPAALDNMNTLNVPGVPYGAAVYVPFTVPAGVDWTVSGLFGNVISDIGALDPSDAFWTINTGVGVGTAGTVIASGVDTATISPTGRDIGGDLEYTVSVRGLTGIPNLTPGDYWFAVVPFCTNANNPSCNEDFSLSNTDLTNAFGPAEPLGQSFWDSPPQGANFEAATDSGDEFDAFSAGIIGVNSLVSKAFDPNFINLGDTSTLTITLSFIGGGTLDSDFTDTLPAGVSLTTPDPTTTCGGVLAFDPLLGTVTLPAGSTIPAAGTCTITATVTGSTPGTFPNTIPADSFSVEGTFNSAFTANLLVARICP